MPQSTARLTLFARRDCRDQPQGSGFAQENSDPAIGTTVTGSETETDQKNPNIWKKNGAGKVTRTPGPRITNVLVSIRRVWSLLCLLRQEFLGGDFQDRFGFPQDSSGGIKDLVNGVYRIGVWHCTWINRFIWF
ncbi:MAG: hypothetical protein ACPG40_01370 [Alphaproteobacteria bacterium]